MKLISILALALAIPGWAEAQNQNTRRPRQELTQAERQGIAQAHQKMAECLRSDSTLSNCRQQMMDECKAMGVEGQCPMMGMMEKGPMMQGGRMQQGTTGASQEPQSGASRQQNNSEKPTTQE